MNLRTAVSVIILKNNECTWNHTHICRSCKLSGSGGSTLFIPVILQELQYNGSCGAQEYREVVHRMLEAHVRYCTSGKRDGCCTDVQMKEHNRVLMNGDLECQHYNMWERRPEDKREEIQDVGIVRNCII